MLTGPFYFYIIRNMKMPEDAEARIHYFASLLKALSSPARLKILRLLIQYGEPGCCVSDIQREVGGANSTLSHHLDKLSRYGLTTSRKQAQWIFYSVNFPALQELLDFLWKDCCSRSSRLVEFRKR
ncbi:MAG: transcriptional regulator [Acidobacteria bacterium]|nr:MAG: transcriptional regulator [Acidobacteriota bacterium]